MNDYDFLQLMKNQLLFTLEAITPAKVNPLADWIFDSKRVFLLGKGRTGLVVAMFAMRLTQLGISTSIIGQPTTPAIQPDDLLILASGSGETKGVLSAAKQAADIGTRTFCLTMKSNSTLSKFSKKCLIIPVLEESISEEFQSKVMLGTLFEQSLLIACDQIVVELMNKSGENFHTLSKRHANIE